MSSYLVSLLNLALINAILVVGLNVQWGWAGELNLAYFGFIALGAYTDGVLTLPKPTQAYEHYILGLNLPFVVGLLGAALVCAIVAAVVGSIALRRVRGDYFAIVTVSAAIIFSTITSQQEGLFNGQTGLYGYGQPLSTWVSGAGESTEYFLVYAALSAVVLLVVLGLLNLVYRSPFGLTLLAIRENPDAARAYGHNVAAGQLKAFVIGSGIAGLGGSLLAHYVLAFSPAAWAPGEAFLLLAGLIIGGSGRNVGAIAGAVLVIVAVPQISKLLPSGLASTSFGPGLEGILVALMLIALIRFRPAGLIPERRRRDPEVAAVESGGSSRADAAPSDVETAPTDWSRPRRLAHSGRTGADLPTEDGVPALRVQGLARNFGHVAALSECSLEVAHGSFTGIIGPNGAGKSTLLEVVSGMQRPDAGHVYVYGREVTDWPAHKISRLGVTRTFQSDHGWAELPVIENLLAAAPSTGVSGVLAGVLQRRAVGRWDRRQRERAREVLSELNLYEHRNEKARVLSGGQSRLLELGRAMMAETRLLLLDEPLAGVHPLLGEHIAQLLTSIQARGTTVVVIEHNLSFITDYCEHVIVMAQGRAIATGTMTEVRKLDVVVEALLGARSDVR